ncbi:AAA family ATPase [Pseudomonas viridiflava]|uniref:AAA family ATPase n=1 Tax=Pseudomonas viridiflava TaxID=33069 RepID=UPI000F06719A|nr:AAA family ATPase [Pseudomonas viridiflava]
MIIAIQKLKGFGIFKDYTNISTQDFGRYNLIYGWNGTGKSTLSNLLSSLEKKAHNSRFPESKYSIKLSDDTVITEKNISQNNLEIKVFNQKFVSDNIEWSSSVKSILLVAKDKIEDAKKLEVMQAQLFRDASVEINKGIELDKKIASQSKFMTDTARHVKSGMQSIDTSDTYYLNYDKRKLESFVLSNKIKVEDPSSILGDEKIAELAGAAKSEYLPSLSCKSFSLAHDFYQQAVSRLRDLLNTTAVSISLERLTLHSDIQKWVEDGVELHKRHGSDNCEFCGGVVSPERTQEIEGHFNNAYKEFQARLISARGWLKTQLVLPSLKLLPSSLYKEFQKSYDESFDLFEKLVNELNAVIFAWQEAIEQKINNPFDKSIVTPEVSAELINRINSAYELSMEAINKHNNKSENFKAETGKSKLALELHFAASEFSAFGFSQKNQTIGDERVALEKISSNILDAREKIKTLEQSLSNETVAEEKFNESLHKFIGRTELCLRFNKLRKGYEIIRNNEGDHDGNLSEGEKTAIAFIYFITKLEENNKKIKDTIIVVDDPVSSFDSNHLFHAYSFLRTQCVEAKQLFVLTHNFTYYKLVRDWFETTNRNRRLSKPTKSVTGFFYTIKSNAVIPRSSALTNADPSLVKYNSEYHYIFSRLYEYKEKITLNRDEAFLTANLSRKLVESFFTFKFPKGRSNISALLESGLHGCTVTTAEKKEKIYRFINKYSHSDVIEINDEAAENLAGEGYSVIRDIFSWIEEVDAVHYNEMVEVVSTN